MKKYDIYKAKEILLNNNLELLETKYKNTETTMQFKCLICNNFGKNCLNNINRGQGCKVCKDELSASKKRFNIDYAKEVFLNNNLELIDTIYVNARTPMRYRCLKCNNIGSNQLSHIKNRKQGCSECYFNNNSGENHWNWNDKKTALNKMIRIKKSKHWIIKNMKDDPNYNDWLINSKDYEIHHSPQINDYCNYILNFNLIKNNNLINFFREIANTRDKLSIISIYDHKQIHKTGKLNFNIDLFYEFLIKNNYDEYIEELTCQL